MSSVGSAAPGDETRITGAQRRLANGIKESMRDLRIQLAVLNHRVGMRLALKDGDLDCLDVLVRYGPLSPSALARHVGVHPATMTGVLDRLEKGGWVVRDRAPTDRRAVVVRPLRDRAGEVFRLYAGMNDSLDEICSGYDEAQLTVLADFLRRAVEAGRAATDELAAD
jgi:DNA-binding MarR family transcriptional regulator